MKHRFLVAQLGARRHYAIPRMLHEGDLLKRFCTDICAVKGWPRLLRVLPIGLQPRGLRRLLGVCRMVCQIKNNGIDFSRVGLQQGTAQEEDPGQAATVHIAFGKNFAKQSCKKGWARHGNLHL